MTNYRVRRSSTLAKQMIAASRTRVEGTFAGGL